jgi:hypothetical protein
MDAIEDNAALDRSPAVSFVNESIKNEQSSTSCFSLLTISIFQCDNSGLLNEIVKLFKVGHKAPIELISVCATLVAVSAV